MPQLKLIPPIPNPQAFAQSPANSPHVLFTLQLTFTLEIDNGEFILIVGDGCNNMLPQQVTNKMTNLIDLF